MIRPLVCVFLASIVSAAEPWNPSTVYDPGVVVSVGPVDYVCQSQVTGGASPSDAWAASAVGAWRPLSYQPAFNLGLTEQEVQTWWVRGFMAGMGLFASCWLYHMVRHATPTDSHE